MCDVMGFSKNKKYSPFFKEAVHKYFESAKPEYANELKGKIGVERRKYLFSLLDEKAAKKYRIGKLIDSTILNGNSEAKPKVEVEVEVRDLGKPTPLQASEAKPKQPEQPIQQPIQQTIRQPIQLPISNQVTGPNDMPTDLVDELDNSTAEDQTGTI